MISVRRRSAGNTLMDVMASLSLVAILLGCGVLGLRAVAEAFSLDTGSRVLAMALTQARIHAISRGRVITTTFGTHTYRVADTETGEVLLAGDVPLFVTIASEGPVAYMPLGTVAGPVEITLRRHGAEQLLRVQLTGGIEVE